MGPGPEVTVLMPVYNGASFLPEAIESILRQTFRDFEFLIIDDGSLDDSCSIVERYGDPRIRLLKNATNLGIVARLNQGFRCARGKYIARMDCDDISLPARLQKQYDYMEAHPDVRVCGTWIDCFGELKERWRYPLEHREIACRMLFSSPIGHATAMFRRQLLGEQHACYAEDFPCAEDYELWSRLCLVTQLANLGEVLYRYRRHRAQSVIRDRARQTESAARVQRRLFERLGLLPTEDELRLHAWAVRGGLAPSREGLGRLDSWFVKLVRANQKTGRHQEELLMKVVLHYWWKACWLLSGDMETWSLFRTGEVYRIAPWLNRSFKSVLLGMKNVYSAADRAVRRKAGDPAVDSEER